MPYKSAIYLTISVGVSLSYKAVWPVINPICSRTFCPSSTLSYPLTEIEPEEGFNIVAIILRAVVLPAPFGPNNPKILPGWHSNEILSTAQTFLIFLYWSPNSFRCFLLKENSLVTLFTLIINNLYLIN